MRNWLFLIGESQTLMGNEPKSAICPVHCGNEHINETSMLGRIFALTDCDRTLRFIVHVLADGYNARQRQ